MEKYYTTGKFAKKAGTTERTIRYYDKIGLLKPTHILDNGYRQYTERDLFKLQRIMVLQYLGCSLDEIVPILSTDRVEKKFSETIDMQLDIISTKIEDLETLRNALIKTNSIISNGNIEWKELTNLIKISNEDNEIIQQYRNTTSLLKKIDIHNKYSVNTENWFKWVYRHIDFTYTNRLLELGCGNGELWKNSSLSLRHREFFLTDVNNTMLNESRKNLGNSYNYILMNIDDITFRNQYFDTVIANHVLFYSTAITKSLSQIHNILTRSGKLYCTTYGKKHMSEIETLVKEYDSGIHLMEGKLYEKFGIENAKQYLNCYFTNVEFIRYNDYLKIYNVHDLMEYIMNCPGNQNEIIGNNLDKFKQFLKDWINEKGYLYVTKDVGMFICHK